MSYSYTIHIPQGHNRADLIFFCSTTTLLLDSDLFWKPQIKGFNSVKAPVYCFLVSDGHRHIVFDLGVRRDWENYAPSTVSIIKSTTEVETDKNVSEILDSDVTGLALRVGTLGPSFGRIIILIMSETHLRFQPPRTYWLVLASRTITGLAIQQIPKAVCSIPMPRSQISRDRLQKRWRLSENWTI